jgi:folliculin
MKDKFFLLNVQPFLANNIKDIAKQIQENAQKIYDCEQKQFPQRAERLNSGKVSNSLPRSLKELTGESNIFAHLHALFSWVLFAGSRYYSEVLLLGTCAIPATLKSIEGDFAFIHIDKEEFLMRNFPSSSEEQDALSYQYNLRALRSLCETSTSFNQILYCSLTGIQIVIRGPIQRSTEFTKYFKNFLPSALHRFIVESNKYLPSNKCKILSLPPDAAITQNNICRIELMNESKPLIKCTLDLPQKLPVLMVKLLHAMDEKMFTSVILDKFIKALIEDWKNKALVLSHQHEDCLRSKLKKTLGIQAQDEALVNYWLSGF